MSAVQVAVADQRTRTIDCRAARNVTKEVAMNVTPAPVATFGAAR